MIMESENDEDMMTENKYGKQNINVRAAQRKRSIFDIEEGEVRGLILSEDSDSNCSSDNIQKAPKSLTDLDLNVLEQTVEKKGEFEERKGIRSDVPEDCFEGTVLEKSEFYDFSKILKSQQEVTVLAQKLTGKQPRQRRMRKRVKNSDDNDIDLLDVKDLLQIGENKKQSTENNVKDDVDGEEEEEEEEEESEISEASANEEIEEIGELKAIQVTIEEPNLFCRGKKGENRLENELKRLLNLKRRHNQLILHKSHLVCLIAHGCFINSVANSEELLAIALSIIPSKKFYPPAKTNRVYVVKLLDWFFTKMKLQAKEESANKSLLEDLVEDFASCAPRSHRNMVLLFILIGRVLGLQCRLVINLCPVPLRPPPVESIGEQQKKIKEQRKDQEESSAISSKGVSTSKVKNKNKSRTEMITKINKGVRMRECPLQKSLTPRTTSGCKNDEKTKSAHTAPAVAAKRKVISSDDEEHDLVKTLPKKKTKKAVNVWSEIYVEAEAMWVSVNVVQNEVDCVEQIYESCSSPVSYILAWNSDGTIKDVTRRYVSQWHMCLKTRVEFDWWNLTLIPWKPHTNHINEKEDEQLERAMEKMPLPTSIREFKNHPLYALKRDLLKFEAIYPPTAVALGQIKGEDIYARACVVELHTKEAWKKEGKVLRPNQKPYKIVKARPKREKGSNKLIKDLPLNLYGHWQVQDYIPPAAANGKVPRNEFGNVEVYKPTMLPKGTAHLQLPGLMRVAKKLGIDCAHAVVGWEFRGQGSHPVLDGVIICEEFKQQLLDAWNKEIDESEKRHKESQTKRALLNWRKIIKAILLRKKLTSKYGFEFKKAESKPNRCRKKN